MASSARGVHTPSVRVPPDGGSPPVGEPSSASLLTDATGDADVHAFLIADIRGWTRITQERGDEDAARLAGRFAEVTRSVVEAHRGKVLELANPAIAEVDAAQKAVWSGRVIETIG